MINVLLANSRGGNVGLIESIEYLHLDTQVQNSSLPLRSESALLLSKLPKPQVLLLLLF